LADWGGVSYAEEGGDFEDVLLRALAFLGEVVADLLERLDRLEPAEDVATGIFG